LVLEAIFFIMTTIKHNDILLKTIIKSIIIRLTKYFGNVLA